VTLRLAVVLALAAAGCGDLRLLHAHARRGDTIVFLDPCRPGTRVDVVVALAGDTVEIRCGVLFVNGAEAGAAAGDFPGAQLPACQPGSSPPGAAIVTAPPPHPPQPIDACRPHAHYVVPPRHVFVGASPGTGPVPDAAVLGLAR
jgi:hypothetical protein